MRYGIGIVALMMMVATAMATAAEPAAPLVVREHAGVARTAAAVTGGVPVGPFKVREPGALGLFDADGAPVACQIVPTVVAPDGTLTWALVDFRTDLKPNEVRRFTIQRAERRAVAMRDPVEVEETDAALTITTGPMRAVLSKRRFDLFEQVWLDRNGDGQFTDDERMLNQDEARPAALVLVDAVSGKALATRDGVVHKVSLEDAGPLRATVRVDGAHGLGKGEATYLKYTARLTFRAGSSDVKLRYSIRNTNAKVATAAKIRRATVTLNLAENEGIKEYIVGAGEPHVSRLYKGGITAEKSSQRHWAVRLEQRGPDRPILSRTHRATFHMGTEFDEMGYRVIQEQPGKPTKRHRFVDAGMRCGGWLDLADTRGGCLVWLRNFSQNPLKRLRATAHGRIDLDVIPEYDGDHQMFYAGGGYWITDRAYRTYEIGFHFHAKPYAKAADWKRWFETFPIYDPVTAETRRDVEAAVTAFEHPLVAVCDPRWLSDTKTMAGPIPSVEDETRVNRMWGRVKAGPVRPDRQEVLGTDFLPRENYHWRSESDEPRDCLIQYARTGEYDFLRRARSFANVARDMGVFRSDGKALGQRPAVRIAKTKREEGKTGTGWGSTKMCNCHNYGAGLIDMWLMTGDRSYRDAAIDNAEYVVAGRLRPVSPLVRRGFSRLSAGLLRAFEVTHDPRYRDKLANGTIFPPPSDALRRDGLGVSPNQSVGSWIYAIAVYAIHRNLTINFDAIDPLARDISRDRIIAWARVGASHHRPGVKPKTKTGYGLTSLRLIMAGYELTGDRKILEAAATIWNRRHKLGDDLVDARLRDWGPSSGANLYWARHIFENYAHPRKDAAPPAAVTDLAAEALGGGAVKLTWSAPEDRGGGAVAEYQLKHAALPIVTWDEFYATYPNDVGKKYSWFGAYNVAGEPTPAAPGTKQSMTVENVPADSRHFRLRTWDDTSNQSALSNEVKIDVK